MSFTKLTTYRKIFIPGGFALRGGLQVTASAGTSTVTMDLPLLFLSDTTAIAPVVTGGEDGQSVSVRLDAWQAVYLHDTTMVLLPLVVASQELAVRMLVDFQADQAMTWTAPTEQITAWCQRWADALARELASTPNPSC
ncbi:hypothetical protein [Amycolatopsis sp. NPDC059657]|uniref:hypothetical protein n=1 Tax=Amycolatopsis sp. NPDC059657 TaxID=3346899 RepID=UPI00367225C7